MPPSSSSRATSQPDSTSSDRASMGRPVRNSSATASSNSSRLSTRTAPAALPSCRHTHSSLHLSATVHRLRSFPFARRRHAWRRRSGSAHSTRTTPPAPQGPGRRSARTPRSTRSARTGGGPPALIPPSHPRPDRRPCARNASVFHCTRPRPLVRPSLPKGSHATEEYPPLPSRPKRRHATEPNSREPRGPPNGATHACTSEDRNGGAGTYMFMRPERCSTTGSATGKSTCRPSSPKIRCAFSESPSTCRSRPIPRSSATKTRAASPTSTY